MNWPTQRKIKWPVKTRSELVALLDIYKNDRGVGSAAGVNAANVKYYRHKFKIKAREVRTTKREYQPSTNYTVNTKMTEAEIYEIFKASGGFK